jgi:hypothetical protein
LCGLPNCQASHANLHDVIVKWHDTLRLAGKITSDCWSSKGLTYVTSSWMKNTGRISSSCFNLASYITVWSSMLFESMYSRRVVFQKSRQLVTIQRLPSTIQRVVALATQFWVTTQKPWRADKVPMGPCHNIMSVVQFYSLSNSTKS